VTNADGPLGDMTSNLRNSHEISQVPADLRKILKQNLKHDLTKIPPDCLAEHFA
jgi:hypothetical protein